MSRTDKLEALAKAAERTAKLARAIADLEAQELLDEERVTRGIYLIAKRNDSVCDLLSELSGATTDGGER